LPERVGQRTHVTPPEWCRDSITAWLDAGASLADEAGDVPGNSPGAEPAVEVRRARGRVLELELRVGVVEHGKRGVRDLVADAVARENQYLQCWNLKIAAKTPRAPRNATTVFIGD